MKRIVNFFDGKKTYLVSVLIIVFALSGAFTGQFSWDHAVELILGALGMGALRNAI